jgi:putative DNA primase/helicase
LRHVGHAYAPPRELMLKQFTTNGLRMLWRHRGCFWLWSGSRYQLANEETIHTHIWTFLEKAKRLNRNHTVDFKPKRAHIGEIAAALTAICQLDEYIDPPAWLSLGASKPPAGEFLACGNGLLHLPSGKLHPATPDYFGLNASEVVYDRKAKAPQWQAFLKELLDKDRQAIDALQDWTGYVLSPDTSQQKIGGIIGPPRSGKGTIARIWTKLLGATSVAGPSMNSLGEQFGLEPLIPKPLAIISDVRIGARTDKSTVVERLLSISSEDRMTVARKFLPAWHGRLPSRMTLLSNELFALNDGSGAFASRLVLVVLIKSFLGKEDPQLTEKLTAELPGILNWGIAGYRRLNKRGYFIVPKSAREAIEAIEMLGAPVKAFVRDRVGVKPGLNVPCDDLYQKWRGWCVGAGRHDPGSKEWFGRNLRSIIPGLRVIKKRGGEDGTRVLTYEGIGLLPEAEAKPPGRVLIYK